VNRHFSRFHTHETVSLVTVTALEPGWVGRYKDLAMNWTLGFESWHEREIISLLGNVQTGFGAHPASYSMGTGFCFVKNVSGA